MRVIVLDSQSTDATAKIAVQYDAEVVQFTNTGGYPKKRQWALENFLSDNDWVLFCDADEVVLPLLWEEIGTAIAPNSPHAGYLISKGFHWSAASRSVRTLHIVGRPFRSGGFSHQVVLLVRRAKSRFERLIEIPGDTLNMEVHERVIVDGSVSVLHTPLIHEDVKGLHAYIDKHNRYSTWEAHLRHRQLTTGRYGEDIP
jgi:glycosyltransferase involved in cell wall biosynthesis